jgi:hypothetical protein
MRNRTTLIAGLVMIWMSPSAYSLIADDLPEGGAGVLDQLNESVAQVERQAEARIADVTREIYAIEDEAAAEARELTLEAIDKLKALQEDYTRDGMLDEAVAIREIVRSLEAELESVEIVIAPSTIDYNAEVGTIYYFRVTGDSQYGSVWGTDVYTYDSYIAVAAVHAGALRHGESGIVKVTVLPGQEMYQGSERNGVTSYEYGKYSLSYKIEPASPVVRAQARREEMNEGSSETDAPNEEQ